MTRLGIDFIAQRAAISRPGAVLLICGAVAMGISVEQYFTLHQQIADLKENLGAIAATAKRERDQPLPDTEQLRARIQLASQVVQKRAVPWDALFRDIEAASDKDVGVLSVQPDAGAKVLRITGEARNSTALAAYIERLEKQPSLGEVYLAEHELRQESGRSPLRFGLQATWVIR